VTAITNVGTLVVGAGPTGLGALWAIGDDPYLLVEGSAEPGGAAGSETVDGFTWDFGGHVIHSHFDEFDQAIAAAGIAMRQIPRNGAVFMDGDFWETPIQQQLDEMPDDIFPGREATNLYEYFLYEMGADLTKRFFEPFNYKMWANDLRAIDHEWTSLRSGSGAANVPRVGIRTTRKSAVETFPYPVDGTGSIWSGIAQLFNPKRQSYGRRLVAVDLIEHVARFEDGDVEYDRLISTIPIDQLAAMTGDSRLAELGGSLLHTGVTAIGIGFEGTPPPALADRTYIYDPDASVAWHRATVLSNYSDANAPVGCWSILFEIGTSSSRSVSAAEAHTSVLDSLVTFGVDLESKRAGWRKSLDYGYPVPTLGRDQVLRELHSALEGHDVFSRGRFGGWRYESCNQDYSFAQGVEAVRGLDEVLWRPEQF
jgi:protoporphyrinogen oxidase